MDLESQLIAESTRYQQTLKELTKQIEELKAKNQKLKSRAHAYHQALAASCSDFRHLSNYASELERDQTDPATVINQLACDVYALACDKGWHRSLEDAYMGRFIANLHSEASELWEAYRRNALSKPCDKAEEMEAIGLKPLTCLEEELADIVIRALDTAKAFGVNIGNAIHAKHTFNRSRPERHGGKAA